MLLSLKRIIRLSIMTVACLCILPLYTQARIFVDAEIVSGTITAVQDNAVELDGNGTFYYPANEKNDHAPQARKRCHVEVFLSTTAGVSRFISMSNMHRVKNTLAKSIPPRVVKTKKIS